MASDKTLNYKLPFSLDDWNTTSKKAKEIATRKKITVEYEFNGTICLVD